jgi:hypothetical protein
MVVITKVRDGSYTLFWKDRWLNGRGVKDIAPAIYCLVPKRIRNTRKVKEVVQNFRWVADFREALTATVLMEYLELYQELEHVELHPDLTDEHIWQLSSTGQFSSKSAYNAMFQEVILFEPAERV